MPAFLMELAIGETASMVLNNRRMLPERIQKAGYVFRHPEAEEALQDLFKTQ